MSTDLRAEIIKAEGVTKRFGALVAVDRVDYSLREHEVAGIIGSNGAGKTTFFNLLTGYFPPDEGTILYKGDDVTRVTPQERVAKGMMRTFQLTSTFDNLSVIDNLVLSFFRAHRKSSLLRLLLNTCKRYRNEDKIVAILETFDLQQVRDRQVKNLSLGEKRRLEIAMAVLAEPEVLLLDEPLAGLAAAERERIVGMIRTLSQHMSVLLVEHDIDRVFEFADRITAMANGVVLIEGNAEQVSGDRQVQEVYLGSGRKVVMQSRSAAQAGEVLLQLDNVNTFYGKSHILHDVSMEVRVGEVTALLGRNGAGKSSTFKSIMGLVPTASGTARFDGKLISGHSPEHIARAGIGLVPQGRRLFPGLTVAENLRLGGLSRGGGAGVHWDRERIFSYFPRIRDKLDTNADMLSGGEQQMVAIARALSGNVRLLMLDEPFEGLAPAVVEEVFKSLDQLR